MRGTDIGKRVKAKERKYLNMIVAGKAHAKIFNTWWREEWILWQTTIYAYIYIYIYIYIYKLNKNYSSIWQ